MTAASGSVPSIAIDVIHPGLRATAASVVAVVQNLFGLAAGPFIADRASQSHFMSNNRIGIGRDVPK